MAKPADTTLTNAEALQTGLRTSLSRSVLLPQPVREASFTTSQVAAKKSRTRSIHDFARGL